eukprot:Platyproteum_vivax@DN7022_c0_g1_i4.p1
MAQYSNSSNVKLFVGGLSFETTRSSLYKYFEPYGAITDCVAMVDKANRPRGFGFVTFESTESATRVLQDAPHVIDDRQVDVKRAEPMAADSRPVNETSNQSVSPVFEHTKIFVGGLAPEVNEENFRQYFEQFGKIVESFLLYDQSTSHHRGFGFVCFEDKRSADEVLACKSEHIIAKKWVEVKLAQTKESMPVSVRRSQPPPQPQQHYVHPGMYSNMRDLRADLHRRTEPVFHTYGPPYRPYANVPPYPPSHNYLAPGPGAPYEGYSSYGPVSDFDSTYGNVMYDLRDAYYDREMRYYGRDVPRLVNRYIENRFLEDYYARDYTYNPSTNYAYPYQYDQPFAYNIEESYYGPTRTTPTCAFGTTEGTTNPAARSNPY